MSLTRQHFEAVAADVHRQVAKASDLPRRDATRVLEALYELTLRFTVTFGRFNPAFDRERFILACGFAALTTADGAKRSPIPAP